MSKQSLQERAVELVAQYTPQARAARSFAYYGDIALGKTWAGTIGQNRDSDALERSNYRVIVADMCERFPEDIADQSASHWAVGHCNTLYVRMLDDKGTITSAGEAILEWMDKLADYPIADEEDHTMLQSDDEDAAWESYGRREFVQEIRKGFGCDYLDIPDATLDRWRWNLHCEHDSEGASWAFETYVADMTWEDILPFDTDGELVEAWRAADDNLPPYLRSTVPPWVEPTSISMPPEGAMS